ncbi:MAG: flagellar FliJ family protein [Phycisphaerae bacterium]|nr:flagellar FliJ family protein [Phycisphaerae bacterium]
MAKRFTFRFETMLRIRRQREDERKRIVASRLREIRNLQKYMASLEQQIHDELRAIRIGRQPGTIDMQQIIRHRQWLGCLHKSVLEGQAKARFLEAELARERADLADAAKQRRILEKLKERQWEQHRSEQDRVEALAADDLTTVRFVFDQQVGAS